MSGSSVECAHCGYEIATYSEAVEALEGGGRCLLCGGSLDTAELQEVVDAWEDEEIVEEGRARGETEADVDEEEDLFEGVPDFGDEGEDEPVL